MFRYLSYIIILTLSFTFIGCKQKNTKQQLINEIEHYRIDTIEAKPVDTNNMTDAQRCRYRADEVLRKYPEMYHAADKVQKKFDRWKEQELIFIDRVFVNKDKEHAAVYRKQEKILLERLDKLNFIYPLCAVLCDDAETDGNVSARNDASDADNEEANSPYRKIMFIVNDGIKESAATYSTDEMRSAVEKARRAWTDYMSVMPELLKTMPEQCVPYMENAIETFKRLHDVDLHNCYLTYWSNIKPAWLLKDDCTDEQLSTSNYEALKMCEWCRE